jgi:hypothetical protein
MNMGSKERSDIRPREGQIESVGMLKDLGQTRGQTHFLQRRYRGQSVHQIAWLTSMKVIDMIDQLIP